jgi:NADH-quinone oxidoreductase subunit L
MGGLGRLLPKTYAAMLIGALALAGIPPLAGFFSKDSLLAAALEAGPYGWVLWAVGLAGTFLTGLYTFRMIFLVFGGEPSPFVREHLHRPGHTMPALWMAWTVGALAILSVVGGWLQFAGIWHPLSDFIEPVAVSGVEPSSLQDAVTSVLAVGLGALGIGIAWWIYSARRDEVPRFELGQRVLERKFHFDELYDAAFYRPAAWLAAGAMRLVEEPLIGGSIRGLAGGTRVVATRVTAAQTGLLRTYALALGSGAAILTVVFLAVRG